ncbi:MAG: hypothetical protein PHG89_00380 [Gallionella sp.]|nr:hypothetical protein [Gallionella sp.]
MSSCENGTDEAAGETTSHLTRLSNNDGQVIGYSHSARPPKGGDQVADYGCGFFAATCLFDRHCLYSKQQGENKNSPMKKTRILFSINLI